MFPESLPSNGLVRHILYSLLNDVKPRLLLRPLGAGFLLQSLWFNPGKFLCEIRDERSGGEVGFRIVFSFPLIMIIPSLLHTHLSPPPEV
jgi:hypothetical protein